MLLRKKGLWQHRTAALVLEKTTCEAKGNTHRLQVAEGQGGGLDIAWPLLLMSTWVLCSPHSLGVVLSRGHGEYILLGNTTVEEGGSVPNTGEQCGRKMDSPGTLSKASLGQSQSLPGPGLEQSLRARLPGKEGSVCPMCQGCRIYQSVVKAGKA